MILTLRTDKPEAEIGLYDGDSQRVYLTWQAHRLLAETIHKKILEVVTSQQVTLADITGIAVYQGPGSFTGLRIGLSVANALATSLNVPIAGHQHDDWLEHCLRDLAAGVSSVYVLPEYGAPVHITAPKK